MYKEKLLENVFMKDKLKFYKKEFDNIHIQFLSIVENILSEKKSLRSITRPIKQTNKILANYAEMDNETGQDEIIVESNVTEEPNIQPQQFAELLANINVLNRKCMYLEHQENNQDLAIKQLKVVVLKIKREFQEKIYKMSRKEKYLLNKLEICENKCKTHVNATILYETQKKLDDVCFKYRQLLEEVEKIMEKKSTGEINVLNESIKLLQNEKNELVDKLDDTVAKLYLNPDNPNTETLARKLAESEVNTIIERQRANHANNLYELVKEQLSKSEERFNDLEIQNKEVLKKNLILQENFKDIQDRILNNIDISVFTDLQKKCSTLLKENAELSNKNKKLVTDVKHLNEIIQTQAVWLQSQEYTYSNLKHQLIDLQATTDEKTVIARLSSDILHARLAQTNCEKKVTDLLQENEELEDRCEILENLLFQEKEKYKENLNQLNQKIW